MDTLLNDVPGRRRLFRSGQQLAQGGSSIIIPTQTRKRGLRWVIVFALVAGLWGLGMAGQLASETLLHQGAPVLGTLETSGRVGP
jgi:hypothetical protein